MIVARAEQLSGAERFANTVKGRAVALAEWSGVPAKVDEAVVRADTYFRNPNTTLASRLRRLSDKTGLEYRQSPTKRDIDIVVTISALPFVAPVVGASMAARWVEDGRPFFYPARRVTRGGKEFNLWKVRTLNRDADLDVKENRENELKAGIPDDPRATPVGSVLRETNLDELPQVVNILKGEITLVGPRAQTRSTEMIMREKRGKEQADQYIGNYNAARPGLFNPQRSLNNGNGSPDMRYHLNEWYMRKAAIGTDLYIVWRQFAHADKAKKRIKKRAEKTPSVYNILKGYGNNI